MQDRIDEFKAEFTQAVGGLKHALATTPDDRLSWAPSSTARSPLQVAAHVAISVRDMLGNLTGNTFPIESTEEAERYHRHRESHLKSRDEVLGLLDEATSAYFAWLDQLTEDQLDTLMLLPFNMGQMPVRMGISMMPFHVYWHTAQINYIQTIYGDHDWHLPSYRPKESK